MLKLVGVNGVHPGKYQDFMYLRQITLTGGIPFSLSLPKAPAALNADTMTDDQLHAALQAGIKEIRNGDTVDAASAFAQFREQHR